MNPTLTSPLPSAWSNWKYPTAILTLAVSVTLGWYLALRAWPAELALCSRYTAGHPIEYLETFLFFWAACALCGHLLRQRSEFSHLRQLRLNVRAFPGDNKALSNRPETSSPAAGRSLVLRRWQQFCQLLPDLDHLQSEMRHWHEEDAQYRDSEYSFVRYLIWAIPILGFLGTVVGITEAIGNVRPEEITNSIALVTAGLAIAFDTTAIALIYSLALMLLLFVSQRRDGVLLDELADVLRTALDLYQQSHPQARRQASAPDAAELLNRYLQEHQHHWLQAFAEQWQLHIEQACRYIRAEMERWRQTFRETQEQWQHDCDARQRQLLALSEPIVDAGRDVACNLVHLSNQLAEAQRQAAKCLAGEERILQLQASLHQTLQSLAQAEMLNKAVHSLTAAVHLLTSRVEISRAA